jgi:GntR family histidine utilization transcriptional repressor
MPRKDAMRGAIAALDPTQPRYCQVKQYVLNLIRAGHLTPGQRVPSENELADSLNVSRMTANRALKELADEDFLVRVAGVGTFVAEPRPHSHVLMVRNIADEIHARGHVHTSKVITLEEVAADAMVAKRLDVQPGEKLFHSLILHLESGKPVQLEERYVIRRVAPGYLQADFTKITPNAYLTQLVPVYSSEHVIRAVQPSAKVRRLLRMEENEPCLVIRRRTWTNGRPVGLAELSHPGYSYELIGTVSE